MLGCRSLEANPLPARLINTTGSLSKEFARLQRVEHLGAKWAKYENKNWASGLARVVADVAAGGADYGAADRSGNGCAEVARTLRYLWRGGNSVRRGA